MTGRPRSNHLRCQLLPLDPVALPQVLQKKGLAVRKTAPVNWCPECHSVLANEQVEGGNCWRHTETPVQQRT